MKEILDNNRVRLYPSDWRYSSAIVGLIRYFKNRGFDCKLYELNEDYIEYEYSLVQDEISYLLFAEEFFSERMHHLKLLQLLELQELTPEQEKLFNEKLIANTVCKKVFSKLKYSIDKKDVFKNLIEDNRLDLIKETFKNSDAMYKKFANEGKICSEHGEVCRLNGYYVDTGRKTKSISYHWDKSTLVYSDEREFDFIPFAFTKTRESFFVNNNYTIDLLIKTNDNLLLSLEDKDAERKNIRKNLFYQSKESATCIDYDVEILTKSQDYDYFETMYVRKKATAIFKCISEKEYNSLCTSLQINSKLYIYIEETVVNSILYNKHLDSLIENSIKKAPSSSYRTQVLIKINSKIYGGENMEDKIIKARNTAFAVKQNIDKNKIKSYRQKLISAISFKDYDRFCQILLQLSDYSGVIFNFAYDLFDDFEANKNIAYSFVNGLNDSNNEGEKQ